MQKPVNIGGTGRERKAGNRNWKKHAGREAERVDSAGNHRTGETYDEAKRHIANTSCLKETGIAGTRRLT